MPGNSSACCVWPCLDVDSFLQYYLRQCTHASYLTPVFARAPQDSPASKSARETSPCLTMDSDDEAMPARRVLSSRASHSLAETNFSGSVAVNNRTPMSTPMSTPVAPQAVAMRSPAAKSPTPTASDLPATINRRVQNICANCRTTNTPLWRRDRAHNTILCNACGIYLKHHGKSRPVDGISQIVKPTPSKGNGRSHSASAAERAASQAGSRPLSRTGSLMAEDQPATPVLSSSYSAHDPMAGQVNHMTLFSCQSVEDPAGRLFYSGSPNPLSCSTSALRSAVTSPKGLAAGTSVMRSQPEEVAAAALNAGSRSAPRAAAASAAKTSSPKVALCNPNSPMFNLAAELGMVDLPGLMLPKIPSTGHLATMSPSTHPLSHPGAAGLAHHPGLGPGMLSNTTSPLIMADLPLQGTQTLPFMTLSPAVVALPHGPLPAAAVLPSPALPLDGAAGQGGCKGADSAAVRPPAHETANGPLSSGVQAQHQSMLPHFTSETASVFGSYVSAFIAAAK